MLAWFGFGTPRVTVNLLRGAEEAPPLDVWVVRADGSAPERWTSDGGYESPVFCEDGTVAAIRDETIYVLGKTPSAARKVSSTVRPALLLACRKGTVGVISTSRDVVLVDLGSGAGEVMGVPIDAEARDVLWLGTRTCDDQTVIEHWLAGTDGHSRIATRTPTSPDEHVIAVRADLPYQQQPAFSLDCSRIVFAGAPISPDRGRRAQPPPKLPPSRGCTCTLIEPKGSGPLGPPIIAGLIAGVLSLGYRRRTAH